MTQNNLHCYTQRLLNPFRGTAAVVETSNARAISIDGYQWRIQIYTISPHHLWGGIQEGDQKKYFNFGVWNSDKGLKEVPLNPILNTVEMIQATDDLLAQLPEQISLLPFPPTDRFELWLLDGVSEQPLALLDTTSKSSLLRELTPQIPLWKAVSLGELGFISPTLLDQGIANTDDDSPCCHIEKLSKLITEQSTPGKNTQWYRHTANHYEAISLDANKDITTSSPASDSFPQQLIQTVWDNADDAALVEDYIHWQAPLLLTLHNLSQSNRNKLEHAAIHRPLEVERHWRLYPEIINKKLLINARVQAKILNAS